MPFSLVLLQLQALRTGIIQSTRFKKSAFIKTVYTLRPIQNGHHFAADIFKCILFNEIDRIPIQISLKSVQRGSIDNKSALVQAMAWHRTGDKPLTEPMMTQFNDAYMRHSASMG